MVMDYTGHHPKVVLQPDMPTGPLNRVADNTLAGELLGWKPQVLFRDGLKRTIDWYWEARDRDEVSEILRRKLTER